MIQDFDKAGDVELRKRIARLPKPERTQATAIAHTMTEALATEGEAQQKRRFDDLKTEVARLLREDAAPALKPTGPLALPDAPTRERIAERAARNVDNRNRQSLARLERTYRREIEGILERSERARMSQPFAQSADGAVRRTFDRKGAASAPAPVPEQDPAELPVQRGPRRPVLSLFQSPGRTTPGRGRN